MKLLSPCIVVHRYLNKKHQSATLKISSRPIGNLAEKSSMELGEAPFITKGDQRRLMVLVDGS